MPGYSVSDPIDALFIQGKVKAFASDLGFSGRESQELAIVASELVTNILKYGDHGELAMEALNTDQGDCLQLTAIDVGPPFRNLDAAMRDGWDDDGPIDPVALLSRKGIGGGLGAVIRLTDAFRVEENPHGKRIITRRYLERVSTRAASRRRI